jgi:hypothetical protein
MVLPTGEEYVGHHSGRVGDLCTWNNVGYCLAQTERGYEWIRKSRNKRYTSGRYIGWKESVRRPRLTQPPSWVPSNMLVGLQLLYIKSLIEILNQWKIIRADDYDDYDDYDDFRVDFPDSSGLRIEHVKEVKYPTGAQGYIWVVSSKGGGDLETHRLGPNDEYIIGNGDDFADGRIVDKQYGFFYGSRPVQTSRFFDSARAAAGGDEWAATGSGSDLSWILDDALLVHLDFVVRGLVGIRR